MAIVAIAAVKAKETTVTNPLDVLGLHATATEMEIRARYLELVRKYPPETAPEKFAEVRQAYDVARNPQQQLRSTLFDPPQDSLDAILADVEEKLKYKRLPTDDLLALGRGSC